jgi:hypothetical protein
MITNRYYIIIENRKSNREHKSNDFHLERINNRQDIRKILSSDSLWYHELGEFIIVTNDDELLKKYIVAINIEEFKMLCKVNFESRKIRINPLHSFEYDENVFKYLEKILNNELNSATMDWKYRGIYIYEMGEYAYGDEYNGWKENWEFNYSEI